MVPKPVSVSTGTDGGVSWAAVDANGAAIHLIFQNAMASYGRQPMPVFKHLMIQ